MQWTIRCPLALMSLAASLLAAGCAGHSLDCITGTSSKDCAPGTIGHQQMVQEQQGSDGGVNR
jgi:hypothetical protein